ncbi:MAG: TetR/AcrR family transcriptional regulator [Acidobacteriota bacterium]
MRGRPKTFDRDEALEAALAVFWEKGFGGTAIGDLTGAMGIGRQSLYDTFGDKHSLYLEALRRYGDFRVGAAKDVLEAPDGTPFENLEAFFGLWKAEAMECTAGCMMVNGSTELGATDMAAARVLEKAMARIEGLVRELFERARAAGELSDLGTPRTFARLVMDAGHGLAARSRLGLDEDDVDDTLGLLMRIVRRRPPAASAASAA